MVLVCEALGFKLAYPKGQIGPVVIWIDGVACIESHGITATVEASIVEDISVDLDSFVAAGMKSKKDLHSLIGKLGHAAGPLIIMRPFLDPLWAA